MIDDSSAQVLERSRLRAGIAAKAKLPSEPDSNLAGSTTTSGGRPTLADRPGRFVLHELWEGVVEEVFDTYFVAQLVSQHSGEREYAEIYTSEISMEDLGLLQDGAVFYWAIGYEDSPSGQRRRSSLMRFRRLPSVDLPGNSGWVDSVKYRWLPST